MTTSWPIVRLGDAAELKTGFPFKSAHYTDALDGIRLLRGDNIIQGTLRWDGVKRWPRDEVIGFEDYALREGDVVLAMDRPWIEAGLKYSSISRYDLPSFLVQRVTRLRGSAKLDTAFLYYIIGSQAFTNHVLAILTGTAVPHISASQIQSFEFKCPPLAEQRFVAHILGTLDDKINLNRRMNETLEATARAIFQSWFVDFDPVRAKAEGRHPFGMDSETAALFPDGFEESDIGKIPKGWKVEPLDEVAIFLNGLALQKYPPEGGNYLPVIKIADMRQGNTEGSDKASTEIPPEYVVHDGDVLFSWSGSLEVMLWCGGDGALNQHLFKVASEEYPQWFYYLWTRHHLPEFQAIAAGKATTMGHIQRHHLSDAKVVVPPRALLDKMTATIQPLLDFYVSNLLQSRSLTTLRDSLLPKLMSGHLSSSTKL